MTKDFESSQLKQLTIEQQSFFDALVEEDSLKLEDQPQYGSLKQSKISLNGVGERSRIPPP
jgi:hypothetical protein